MNKEKFKPSARVQQLIDNYKADYSTDNRLTSEESETLLRLMKKAIAPSSETILARTEEDCMKAQGLANLSDDMMFGGGYAAKIAEEFSEISMQIGFMLGDYMIRKGFTEPNESIMEEFFAEAGLPPMFLSKGTLLAHFYSLEIKDPVLLIVAYKTILQKTPEASAKSILVSAAAHVARKGMMA